MIEESSNQGKHFIMWAIVHEGEGLKSIPGMARGQKQPGRFVLYPALLL